MFRENNSDVKFNELSGLDVFMDRILQGDHPQHEQTPTSKGPQHFPPSRQLSSEETNDYLLPVVTLPLLTCNAHPSVRPSVCVTCSPATLVTCVSSRGCDKGTAAKVLYACLTLMGISSGEGGEGSFCYRDKDRK